MNPYTRLKEQCRAEFSKVVYRKRVGMWSYPKHRLAEGWNLTDLWERVAAAKQLGFDVRLKATDAGLEVEYIQANPDSMPWWL